MDAAVAAGPVSTWPLLARRLHARLPSFNAAFTQAVPLTRIRDIAHRGDIPHVRWGTAAGREGAGVLQREKGGRAITPCTRSAAFLLDLAFPRNRDLLPLAPPLRS